ncbi:MAG: recombinase family protein [Pseudomonadota bacterium]|nr:recombinase family protein [Pseudomonadota bacterium]
MMMLQMIGVFAEFERAMIRERTMAGVKAARLEGRIGGRPRALTGEQAREIVERVGKGEKTRADMARLFRVSTATIGRVMRDHEITRWS